MDGLALLLGHLVGDYVVQNDWMAKHKAQEASTLSSADYWRPWMACSTHCLCYTLAVWAFTFYWMPFWGLAACFLIHWPIDRYRLAGRWMRNAAGQAHFASPEHPMFPWSVVMVDNIFHLLTLYVIWLLR